MAYPVVHMLVEVEMKLWKEKVNNVLNNLCIHLITCYIVKQERHESIGQIHNIWANIKIKVQSKAAKNPATRYWMAYVYLLALGMALESRKYKALKPLHSWYIAVISS